MVNSERFRKAEIVLVFTNIDRFREKVQSGDYPIQKNFPVYQGAERDADSAMDFFTDFFLRAHRVSDRICSVEYTHERDTKLLQKLHSCVDIALQLRGTSLFD